MQHRQRHWLAGGLVFATAGLAPWAAQADGSWYVGAEGGASFLKEQKFDLYGYGLGVEDGSKVSTAEFSTGWLGGISLGYAFDSGLRPELELSYRSNDFDKLTREPVLLLFTGGEADVDGKETAITGMANVWYDFPLGKHWRPYLGGGIGYAQIKIDSSRWGNTELHSDKDGAFAYQGGAGVAFDFDEHWTTSIDYRYFAAQRSSFDLLAGPSGTTLKTDYRAETVMLSLRYRFGAAEPKPAPPAAPLEVEVVPVVEAAPPPAPSCQAPSPGEPISLEGCAVGTSLVLRGVNFEFEQARLTPDAKTLLDQVADELRRRRDINVEIAGHTDGRGSQAYNQELSENRAESVRQFLISRGIAPSRMTAKGLGATVPVADNRTDEGRELNRRVELKVVDTQAAQAPDGATGTAPAEAAPAAEPQPVPVSAPAAEAPSPEASVPPPAQPEPVVVPPGTPVENLPPVDADVTPIDEATPVEALPAPSADVPPPQ